MKETPQKRAIKKYRERLTHKGMARFEVLGLNRDRELLRSVARRLAEDSPAANQLRTVVSRAVAGETKGRILAALRRSPLVGADLNLDRPRTGGRKIEL